MGSSNHYSNNPLAYFVPNNEDYAALADSMDVYWNGDISELGIPLYKCHGSGGFKKCFLGKFCDETIAVLVVADEELGLIAYSEDKWDEFERILKKEFKNLNDVDACAPNCTPKPFVMGHVQLSYRMGLPFPALAEEYVSDETLSDSFKNKNLTPRKAAQVGLQIANVVQKIHDAVGVHRDLKPPNIAYGKSGNVTLLDLGTFALNDYETTSSSTVSWTPGYTAPERNYKAAREWLYRTELQDEKTVTHNEKLDVYSLGMTMAYLRTHASYDNDDNFLSDIVALNSNHKPFVLTQKLDSPHYDDDKALSRIIEGCTQAHPSKRWDMNKLIDALKTMVEEEIADENRLEQIESLLTVVERDLESGAVKDPTQRVFLLTLSSGILVIFMLIVAVIERLVGFGFQLPTCLSFLWVMNCDCITETNLGTTLTLLLFLLPALSGLIIWINTHAERTILLAHASHNLRLNKAAFEDLDNQLPLKPQYKHAAKAAKFVNALRAPVFFLFHVALVIATPLALNALFAYAALQYDLTFGLSTYETTTDWKDFVQAAPCDVLTDLHDGTSWEGSYLETSPNTTFAVRVLVRNDFEWSSEPYTTAYVKYVRTQGDSEVRYDFTVGIDTPDGNVKAYQDSVTVHCARDFSSSNLSDAQLRSKYLATAEGREALESVDFTQSEGAFLVGDKAANGSVQAGEDGYCIVYLFESLE